jgi:predicted small metal-binding protein
MFKQIVEFILIVVLALTFPNLVLAQDKQKESKKEEKMEMTKGENEMGPVKSISCGAECGFMVKGRNEDELISIAKKHVKELHNKKLTNKEVKAMIKTE